MKKSRRRRCFAVVLVPRAREALTRVFLVVLVKPSEARGITPFMAAPDVRAGRGSGHSGPQRRGRCWREGESLARTRLSVSGAAERGGRVCSDKSEHRKIPRRRSGASARAAVNLQQMGCRWGCERRAPLLVSLRARPVVRIVARASSKLAPCANVREFRGKSRARLIPET